MSLKVPSRWMGFSSTRRALIYQVHEDSGHLAVESCFDLLKTRMYHPGMYDEVKTEIERCEICRRSKIGSEKVPVLRIPVGKLFDTFHLDFLGPLETTNMGNKYVLVAIERLSRYPIVLATSNADGTATVEMLKRIEAMFGPPRRIVTDNGTHFVNKEVQALCSQMNTEHHKVLPYHPQANGIAERYVAVIKAALLKSSIKYPKDWDRMMPAIVRYHRARPHSATGVSPFEVVFGQQLRINLDIPDVLNPNYQREMSLESLRQLREDIASEWNASIEVVRSAFTKGTQVYLEKRPLPSNGPLYDGPYFINEALGFNTYQLCDKTDSKVSILVHASRLKKVSGEQLEGEDVVL